MGWPRWAVAGIGVVIFVLAAPGVFAIMNAFTGAHAVLWRAICVAPLPILVAVLAAVPTPFDRRWLAPVPAMVVIAVIVLAGVPFADPIRHNEVADGPTWGFPMDDIEHRRAH